MPTLTQRASQVRVEYRFEEVSDGTVLALYPHADVLELPTNMDSTSATNLASTILTALKTHALAWTVEVDGTLLPEAFDGTVPQYTLSAPNYNTDGRSYRTVSASIDYVNNITTLGIRG